MKYQKDQRERQVFLAFAAAASLPMDPISVVSRDPPEPDIRCTVDGVGPLAFELVEIVDPALASGLSDALELKPLFKSAYEDALRHGRASKSRFENAAFLVKFDPQTSLRRRRAAIAPIIKFLESVPPDFVGECDLSVCTLSDVSMLWIVRGGFHGPIFDVSSGGAICIQARPRIQDKFTKTYHCDAPIEMLAYYHLQPPFPTEIWLPDVRTFIEGNLVKSPFRRVWIFDYGQKAVIHVHPAYSDAG
jgi:hypothetical protein